MLQFYVNWKDFSQVCMRVCVYTEREVLRHSKNNRSTVFLRDVSPELPLTFLDCLLVFLAHCWVALPHDWQLYLLLYSDQAKSNHTHISDYKRKEKEHAKQEKPNYSSSTHIYWLLLATTVLSTYVYIDLYFEPIIMSFEISLQPNKTIGSHKSHQEWLLC